MPEPFCITTPIYYVNARPHLGHAYTTLAADVMTRFKTMQGRETFFLTGTDEHGDKIVEAAREEGITPRTYVDKISQLFSQLWPEMGININHFVRTTDPSHIKVVEQILSKIYAAGDIYFSEYEGLYCYGCERFYTKRELVEGKCPDHGTEPKRIKESNYFFKMSRYQDWLIEHINQNPDFIRPERYKNEVLAFLREPLEDLCISRPKKRLEWGITLPFDSAYVTYVWFDALLNYVSGLGYPNDKNYQTFWPHMQHIVAKDILKPHGIYWPIMLKAAGIPIYKHLNVHGYWNVDQSKMSKSIGNVIEPMALKSIYGLDAFRFFLMRDMAFGLDSNFSETMLVERINSDLANDLGNLFSRVTTMTHKYFDGVVPSVEKGAERDLQMGLQSDAWKAIEAFEAAMEDFAFHKALIAVWKLVNRMNKYIDVTAPWILAKQKSSRQQLKAVIYNLLEGLRVISGLVYPVMPQTARCMQKHLGLDPQAAFFDLEKLKIWDTLQGGILLPKSITLFPRIDKKKLVKKNIEPTPTAPQIKPEISFETVSKLDLRVASIITAEPIPKAKKLLKLIVDIGNSKRTIVAGISKNYSPDELVGKQVVIVANLKPAKLMGVQSEGMLLAAVDDSDCSVVTLDRETKPGTGIK